MPKKASQKKSPQTRTASVTREKFVAIDRPAGGISAVCPHWIKKGGLVAAVGNLLGISPDIPTAYGSHWKFSRPVAGVSEAGSGVPRRGLLANELGHEGSLAIA